jgi:hypothetical protein
MATDIAVAVLSRAGATVRVGLDNCDSSGNTFTNTGKEILCFQNTDVSNDIVANVTIQQTVDGQAAGSKAITCTKNNVCTFAGPFPTAIYNDTNGKVHVTYPGGIGSTLHIAVCQLTPTS